MGWCAADQRGGGDVAARPEPRRRMRGARRWWRRDVDYRSRDRASRRGHEPCHRSAWRAATREGAMLSPPSGLAHGWSSATTLGVWGALASSHSAVAVHEANAGLRWLLTSRMRGPPRTGSLNHRTSLQGAGQGQPNDHGVGRSRVGVKAVGHGLAGAQRTLPHELPSWFQGAATSALGNELMCGKSLHFGSSQPNTVVPPQSEVPSQSNNL